MNIVRVTFCLAGLACSGAALAEEVSATGQPQQGWYVAPMFTYMKADKERCNVNNPLGGAVMLGHRGEIAALEFFGQYLTASHDACTYTVPAPTMANPDARATIVEPAGTLTLSGGGFDVVITPFTNGEVVRRLFGTIGFGLNLRSGQPRYTDGKTIFADAGIGYLHPMQVFGRDMNLRTELRYRYDVQQPPYAAEDQDPPQKHAFGDVIFNVGLQIAFSKPEAPLPPPAPEPVQVVPPAEPAPAPVEPAPAPTAPAVAPSTSESDSSAVIETAKAGDTIVLHGVTFNTGKSSLTSNAKTVLDDVAAKLGARPELKVEIGGHTDNRGNADYNQHLSEKRAQSVLDYLVGKGVDAGRLSAQGYGLSQPVDSNDTDEGREHNRRVELKVLDTAAPAA